MESVGLALAYTCLRENFTFTPAFAQCACTQPDSGANDRFCHSCDFAAFLAAHGYICCSCNVGVLSMNLLKHPRARLLPFLSECVCLCARYAILDKWHMRVRDFCLCLAATAALPTDSMHSMAHAKASMAEKFSFQCAATFVLQGSFPLIFRDAADFASNHACFPRLARSSFSLSKKGRALQRRLTVTTPCLAFFFGRRDDGHPNFLPWRSISMP